MKITTTGKTDNRGRIVDPVTGKPLRDRQNRTPGAFHGKNGKPNRKAAKRLAERIEKYEGVVKRNTNKHDVHKPGSLK